MTVMPGGSWQAPRRRCQCSITQRSLTRIWPPGTHASPAVTTEYVGRRQGPLPLGPCPRDRTTWGVRMSQSANEESLGQKERFGGGAHREGDLERGRLARRQIDQDRTLDAMHALEAALALPAPGRQCSWHDEVLGALRVLADAVRVEADNAAMPDSLLSDLSRTQPHLRNRVRGLRIEYRQLQEAIEKCRNALAGETGRSEVAEVRNHLARLLNGLRDQRAKESDLIYEAYYDAFRSDLPRDARRDFGSA